MAAYQLTAPDGTKVSVEGAERRDALLGRGYTESGGKAVASGAKEKAVEAKAGSNDTVSVNSETGKPGRSK